MRKHIPFLIMGASSGTLFLSNLIAKKTLSTDDYEHFSYFITITSILSSFALFGLEQLIIRFGTSKNNKLHINRKALYLLATTFIFAVLSSGQLLKLVFSSNAPLDIAWLATATLGLTLINYNIFRIKGRFIESQLSNGAWRFSILIFLSALFLKLTSTIQSALYLALLTSLAINFTVVLRESKTLRIESSAPPIAMTSMGFVFSLAIMTILGNFDRIIAERAENPELFSQYVHYSMILIMPFNMIASYIGFKEATSFKLNFSRELLFRKALSCTLKISVAFIAATLIVTPLSGFIEIKISASAIVATYLLIATKCFYSLLSAAMGARGSAKEIWISNFASAILLGSIFSYYSIAVQINSIESILWLFTLLWLSRSICYSVILARRKND